MTPTLLMRTTDSLHIRIANGVNALIHDNGTALCPAPGCCTAAPLTRTLSLTRISILAFIALIHEQEPRCCCCGAAATSILAWIADALQCPGQWTRFNDLVHTFHPHPKTIKVTYRSPTDWAVHALDTTMTGATTLRPFKLIESDRIRHVTKTDLRDLVQDLKDLKAAVEIAIVLKHHPQRAAYLDSLHPLD